MTSRRALALMNPSAGRGAARKLWDRLKDEIACFDWDIAAVDEAEHAVARAWHSGIRLFIALGGDGTVHGLINALVVSDADLHHCLVGAVGLGSSNDFHKPFTSRIGGVPVRLDCERAQPRDVGIASFRTADGSYTQRAFLVSASIGACARANAIFNTGHMRSVARHVPTNAAVLLAGGAAVATHRNLRARLAIDGRRARPTMISNLSIMKTPYLAGGLRYDVATADADGFFAVNLCENMSRCELVGTMHALGRGKFAGRPKTRHWRARTALLETDEPTYLELDGELYATDRVEFNLLPAAIGLCA